MMLQSLFQYAKANGLVEDLDYEPKRVSFVLGISGLGKLQTVQDLRDGNFGPERMIPRWPKRSSGVCAGFLVDNSKYVLGILDPKKPGKMEEKKALVRLSAFRDLVERALKLQPKDPGLLAVSKFYDQFESNRKLLLQQRPLLEWDGSEVVVFQVEGQEEGAHGYAFETSGARTAWKTMRSPPLEEGSKLRRCLITGELAVPEATHPKIKNVPGANSAGSLIVSFNERAFESYGWKQGENAPTSRLGAEGYAAGLNHLLARDGNRRYRSGIGLGEAGVVVLWTPEGLSLSSIQDLLDATSPAADLEAQKQVVEAPFSGLLPHPTDGVRVYAATLSSNSSRIIVHDWFESTLGTLKGNVSRWFDLLAVEGGRKRPQAIWQLLASVKAPGQHSKVPSNLAAKMVSTALYGTPLPLEFLRLALSRLRVPSKDPEKDRFKTQDRVALIKAVLISCCNREVSVSLNRSNTDVAYLCGRLFAVLQRLQDATRPDINAGIGDRYYGAASTTPQAVFPRLLKLSKHHASKAEKVGWLSKVREEIFELLPDSGFPKVLSLQEQGIFTIGYQHQWTALWQKKPADLKVVPNEGSDAVASSSTQLAGGI